MLFRSLGVYGRKRSGLLSTETLSTIYGDNLYDLWDFNDSSSLSLTGSLINSITSQVSARQFTSSGGARPTITTDATLGKDVAQFDGLATYMSVASSTALYNFLHFGQGAIISVWENTDGTSSDVLIANANSSSDVGTLNFVFNSNNFRSAINKGVGGFIGNNISIGVNQYNKSIIINDTENATIAQRSRHYYNATEFTNNTTDVNGNGNDASRDLHMGARPSIDLFWQGNIAMIAIVNTMPTAQQLTATETFLNNTYGSFPIS